MYLLVALVSFVWLFSSVEQACQAVSPLVAFLPRSRESALAHKTTENDTISDMGKIVLVQLVTIENNILKLIFFCYFNDEL